MEVIWRMLNKAIFLTLKNVYNNHFKFTPPFKKNHWVFWLSASHPPLPCNGDQVSILILAATNFRLQKLELPQMRWGHLIMPDGGKKFGYLRGWPSESHGGWQDVKVRYWKIRFMLPCQGDQGRLPAWLRRQCVVWTSRKRKSATQSKNYPVGHPKMILTSA